MKEIVSCAGRGRRVRFSATCRCIVCFIVICLFTQNHFLYAQNPDAYFRRLAGKFGISPHDRRLEKVISRIDSPPGSHSEYGERSVIRHIRGKSGIPFPKSRVRTRAIRFSKKDIAALNERASRLLKKYAGWMFQPRMLGPCTISKSEKTSINIYDGKYPNVTFRDLLFIDRKDVPKEPEKVFGKNVTVFPYTPNKKNPVFYQVVGFGIKCLPTRLRITGKYLISSIGSDALKNYDKSPNGRGFTYETDSLNFR